jgi:hypothetical protein
MPIITSLLISGISKGTVLSDRIPSQLINGSLIDQLHQQNAFIEEIQINLRMMIP